MYPEHLNIPAQPPTAVDASKMMDERLEFVAATLRAVCDGTDLLPVSCELRTKIKEERDCGTLVGVTVVKRYLHINLAPMPAK